MILPPRPTTAAGVIIRIEIFTTVVPSSLVEAGITVFMVEVVVEAGRAAGGARAGAVVVVGVVGCVSDVGVAALEFGGGGGGGRGGT